MLIPHTTIYNKRNLLSVFVKQKVNVRVTPFPFDARTYTHTDVRGRLHEYKDNQLHEAPTAVSNSMREEKLRGAQRRDEETEVKRSNQFGEQDKSDSTACGNTAAHGFHLL